MARMIRKGRARPLTTDEVCEALGVLARQVQNLRKSGRIALDAGSAGARGNLYTPASVRAEQLRRRDGGAS